MPTSEEFKALGAQEFKFMQRNAGTIRLWFYWMMRMKVIFMMAKLKGFPPASDIFANLPNLTVVKMDGISKVLLAYGLQSRILTFYVNSLDGQPFSEDELKSECGRN